MDAIDRGEDGHGPGRREALTAKIAKVREQRQVQAALLEQLTASGESQISLTDSDARAMVTGKKTTVGYNAQVAVDAKHKLIVEQHVTNAATDMGLLASTAGAARIVLDVERVAAVADMGYYKGEDIEACEASGRRQARAGQRGHQRPLSKERFRYNSAADAYHCPGGRLLDTRYRSVTNGHVSIQYSSPAACAACTIRARCTGGRWRRINRWENEAVLERMAKRRAERPGILNIRRETVEHPFGSIKQWMNQGAFLMRGLEKVRGEFSLTALVYNLRRAITLIGVPSMIRAVRV
nr:transposase [Sphingomonas melonis]